MKLPQDINQLQACISQNTLAMHYIILCAVVLGRLYKSIIILCYFMYIAWIKGRLDLLRSIQDQKSEIVSPIKCLSDSI